LIKTGGVKNSLEDIVVRTSKYFYATAISNLNKLVVGRKLRGRKNHLVNPTNPQRASHNPLNDWDSAERRQHLSRESR
jgi:hypothetical protein